MSLSVGERLKSAREGRKVSLEEACRITKIQRQTLEAIEEGRIQEVLDPAYARIFVKKYASYLGLDGVTVVNEYQGLSASHRTSVAEAPAPAGRPPPEPASAARNGIGFQSFVSAGVVLVALVGIGFLGYLMVDLVHNLRRAKPAPVAAESVQEKKPRASSPLVPLSKPLRLTIQAASDVWLQVKADGTIIFQNVLPKGGRETWTAKNDLELWTGNGSATKLVLNGKPLEELGRSVRKGVKITHYGIQD